MNRIVIVFTLALLIFQPALSDTRTFTIGGEDAASPWSNPDGTGYVNDLVSMAFAKVNQPTDIVVLPYARCKQQVIHGSLVGCFSASKTPKLEADLFYPKYPVFFARNVLFTTKDSHLVGCSPDGWKKSISIGLVIGYEYRQEVMDIIGSGAVKAEYTSDEILNLRMLSKNRVDGVIINVDEVKSIATVAARAGIPDTFKVACDFGGEPAYIAFSRAHPEGKHAVEAFNRGYEMLSQQGEVEKLKHIWNSKMLNQVEP